MNANDSRLTAEATRNLLSAGTPLTLAAVEAEVARLSEIETARAEALVAIRDAAQKWADDLPEQVDRHDVAGLAEKWESAAEIYHALALTSGTDMGCANYRAIAEQAEAQAESFRADAERRDFERTHPEDAERANGPRR